MKILYFNAEGVESNPELRLRSRGDEVTCVTNREDALNKLAAEKFDAVVIEQDGPDILQFTINARHVRPSVPLFVASVWGPRDLPAALASIRRVCDRMSLQPAN